jgi:hypothetical protein
MEDVSARLGTLAEFRPALQAVAVLESSPVLRLPESQPRHMAPSIRRLLQGAADSTRLVLSTHPVYLTEHGQEVEGVGF